MGTSFSPGLLIFGQRQIANCFLYGSSILCPLHVFSLNSLEFVDAILFYGSGGSYSFRVSRANSIWYNEDCDLIAFSAAANICKSIFSLPSTNHEYGLSVCCWINGAPRLSLHRVMMLDLFELRNYEYSGFGRTMFSSRFLAGHSVFCASPGMSGAPVVSLARGEIVGFVHGVSKSLGGTLISTPPASISWKKFDH